MITTNIFNQKVVLKVVNKVLNVSLESDEDRAETAVDMLIQGKAGLMNVELDYTLLDIEAIKSKDNQQMERAVHSFLGNIGNERITQLLKSEAKYKSDTRCETILKTTVDEETAILLPFRSFSPYQWTTSSKDTSEQADVVFNSKVKPDIVLWYLKGVQKGDIKQEEVEREQTYFQNITGSSGFEFALDDSGNEVVVRNINFRVQIACTEYLLKIPEGIYEAKTIAILLAVERFRTICLDDAERGMHPQMIEILRDIVLADIKDKVVLIITHHPAFLAQWNISRTILFQRKTNTTGQKFSVKRLKDISVISEPKSVQILTSRSISDMLFAETVCLVEGKTEFLFMTALRNIMVQEPNILAGFFPEKECASMRFFFCKLHIVSMDGEAGKYTFRKICKQLELQHIFILDFDALTKNIKRHSGEEGCLQAYRRFCEELHVGEIDWSVIKEDGIALVKILQERSFFIWNKTDVNDESSGRIEDAVVKLCRDDEKVKGFLAENNIDVESLKRPRSGEMKNRSSKKKLFEAKNITDDNIKLAVSIILNSSQNKDCSDINRLIKFFENIVKIS